ncbi:MAG TPA: methylated-DNA--[protein]-cysteine S-methyltransferase [Stellaceae bacterium]|jgi:methylated-DNA-[protein]-cysteine S-methyltransferase|nr:methylated-DNA--[protein]-cysteine S-methyltransferase [Stellaceae bacterium]
MTKPIFSLDRMDTPIGLLLIATDADQRLRGLEWEDHRSRFEKLLTRYHGAEGFELRDTTKPTRVRRALQAYFEGELDAVAALETAKIGTEFQRLVWAGLRRIPAGQTLSYGGLAEKLGRPTASRAVGLANGSNPIPIVVPCHRVIGANGSLTGFGSGLPRKRWLLDHEGRYAGTRPVLPTLSVAQLPLV